MSEPKSKFDVLTFSQPAEVSQFSERNAQLLAMLPELNDAMDSVFRHTVTADRHGLTVFMLGRRCTTDFEEILLLASNGHGFAALSVLRSIFEKLVDATYLHNHPTEVDAYWNYYFVQLEKLDYADIADNIDPNWQAITAQFKMKGKKGRIQPRWAKDNLVKVARDEGLGDLLKHAYYLPNLFIHNSVVEILFTTERGHNGRITPLDSNNPKERRMADMAVIQAFLLMLKTFELEIAHYEWNDSKAIVHSCLDKFGGYLETVKPT